MFQAQHVTCNTCDAQEISNDLETAVEFWNERLKAEAKTMPNPPKPGPPRGLRLSRAAGFVLQVHSRAQNGRDAVNVARPSAWGNPWIVGSVLMGERKPMTAADAVEQFEFTLLSWSPEKREEYLAPLRGKNLACWCAYGTPCHRDILLKYANAIPLTIKKLPQEADSVTIGDVTYTFRTNPTGPREIAIGANEQECAENFYQATGLRPFEIP